MMNLKLLPCPMCGHNLNKQDPQDTVYPLDQEKTSWILVCQESAGGCGTAVVNESIESCVTHWNARKSDKTSEDVLGLKHHLMVTLMEECAEVQQALSKIMRFGETETSLDNLYKEWNDVLAVAEMLETHLYSFSPDEELIEQKRAKVMRYFFNES